MKNKFFLLLLSASAVILVSVITLSNSSLLKRPKNPLHTSTPALTNKTAAESYQAKVIVSAVDENLLIEYESKSEQDYQAFSLLEDALKEKNIPYEVETYNFGVFVKSINGLESTSEKAWIYFVNGESGQIAADQLDLQPGDLVEWKYVTPSE